MDPQELVTILTVFTTFQRQLLLTLESLLNDRKRIENTSFDSRYRIRQLAYFQLIHESDLCCCQSTRMDKRCFAILCHLLRTTARLVETEVIDVDKMVAMFLHIVAHDVKNRMIQREFVRSGETFSRHFNLALLAVLRLHDELFKKPQPVTNLCTNLRWKWFEANTNCQDVSWTCQTICVRLNVILLYRRIVLAR